MEIKQIVQNIQICASHKFFHSSNLLFFYSSVFPLRRRVSSIIPLFLAGPVFTSGKNLTLPNIRVSLFNHSYSCTQPPFHKFSIMKWNISDWFSSIRLSFVSSLRTHRMFKKTCIFSCFSWCPLFVSNIFDTDMNDIK